MPISDKKKCQTLINLIGQKAIILKEIASLLESCRTAYQTQSVDPTGTPLEGKVTAASNWINDVRSVADDVVAEGFINNIVVGHKNKALGDL
jgi:hypothetical protein